MSVPRVNGDALRRTARAQTQWASSDVDERRQVLDAWANRVDVLGDELAAQIVADVRKPITMARDEVRRTSAHIRSTAGLASDVVTGNSAIGDSISVRRVPLGTVGIITPWNNPAALPAAKVAAALMCGNAVVLKPAPEGDAVARALVTLLRDSGCPAELVTVVSGGSEAGASVASSPFVSGIAVTGSIGTGRSLAEVCTRRGTPLQAELGGNNAAVVVGPVDIDRVVEDLLMNAFAFAGQRCTALRRFVVAEDLLGEFVAAVAKSVSNLTVGAPEAETTLLGPVISDEAGRRIREAVDDALLTGCEFIGRGQLAEDITDDSGSILAPVVLLSRDASHSIVQTETFGPVAVIQPARDLDHVLELANGVEQGLLMAVCTSDDVVFDEVSRRAHVGIIQHGGRPVSVHPEAPFGGWKSSGIGTPEHGEWDVQFFTRPQAVYGSSD